MLRNSTLINFGVVLFGHDANFRSNDVLDLIILLAIVLFFCFFVFCFCIYKCKVRKATSQFHLFKQYLRTASEL